MKILLSEIGEHLKRTPILVAQFAAQNNHNFLFTVCELYEQDKTLTWEKAMQIAAIELSIQLKEVREKLIKCKMRYGNLE